MCLEVAGSVPGDEWKVRSREVCALVHICVGHKKGALRRLLFVAGYWPGINMSLLLP